MVFEDDQHDHHQEDDLDSIGDDFDFEENDLREEEEEKRMKKV